MPITLTFDIDNTTVTDANDRDRIIINFLRFGWEHIGGTAWRYPALGTHNDSEDWFNHVIPALMYFRSLVEHANLRVTSFTLDAHSEAGHRGNGDKPLGQPIHSGDQIAMYPPELKDPNRESTLSEARLRRFVTDVARSLA